MDIQELQNIGGLVSDEPVKRKVEWVQKLDDGTSKTHIFDVFVKLHSFGDMEKIWIGDGSDRSKSAEYISRSISLGKDGKEKFSYEQAYALVPSLATAFIDVITKVNGGGKEKKSPPPMRSGTN